MTGEWPPTRLRDLDPRTIEFLARLNEAERTRLIEVGNLSRKESLRLRKLLALPDAQWDAGFKIVTRSAAFSAALRTVPKLVLLIAAVLVAINQIWGFMWTPLIKLLGK